jgi:hypothetical protein
VLPRYSLIISGVTAMRYTSLFISTGRLATVATIALGSLSVTATAQECTMGTDDVPTKARKSLVITKKDGVDLSAFSFERVIGQIIETSDVEKDRVNPDDKKRTFIKNTAAERIALLQGILRSLRRKAFPNGESSVQLEVQPRPEADLTPAMLFDQTIDGALPKGMHPVALFNRFDLTPANFSNCGEHRIVYMLGNGTNLTNRLTFIFEARVENPEPEKGHLGCLPIARFWKSMEGKTPADVASALEEMYFNGRLAAGDPDLKSPVVHFANFGFNRGQVRGNLFVTPNNAGQFKWQLREWHTDLNPDGSPYFRAEPVKDSPFTELWKDLGASSALTDLQKRFKRDFLTANLDRLLQPELAPNGRADTISFVSNVAAGFANGFNGFQHVSQGSEDEPATQAGALKNDLASRISSHPGLSGMSDKPTNTEVLNRAGAVTCGGCHQFSNGKMIGKDDGGQPVRWPDSAGFVHTTEQGGLSPALREVFLVARCKGLNKFLNNTQSFATPTQLTARGAVPMQLELTEEIAKIQGLSKFSDRAAGIARLSDRANILRQFERSQPGAFTPVRRTH